MRMSPVVLQAALVTVFVESNEGYLPAPPPQPIQPRPAGTAKEATCPPPCNAKRRRGANASSGGGGEAKRKAPRRAHLEGGGLAAAAAVIIMRRRRRRQEREATRHLPAAPALTSPRGAGQGAGDVSGEGPPPPQAGNRGEAGKGRAHEAVTLTSDWLAA